MLVQIPNCIRRPGDKTGAAMIGEGERGRQKANAESERRSQSAECRTKRDRIGFPLHSALCILHSALFLAHPSSVASTTASIFPDSVYSTRVSPSMLRNFSAGTFLMGPGDSAFPGSGCGNAVERAVWNVMFPSVF